MISYHRSAEMCWFRIFGWGLAFTDRTKHVPLFSVRNGFVREIRIGRWGVQALRPWRQT